MPGSPPLTGPKGTRVVYLAAMRGLSHRLASWLLVAAHLLSLGCGYQLVTYADRLGDARRVAIQPLVNDSFEPGLESLMADAFHREFERRGALRVVTDPASADLVVGGAIDSLETHSRSFSSIQFALEYEMRLRLEMAVTRPDGTPVPIDQGAFVESELYFASADLEVTRTNREEALRRLAGLMASRLHDALYERIQP